MRYAGAVVTVSMRALIILCEVFKLSAHVGTSPQRSSRASGSPFAATIARTSSVGAMLKRRVPAGEVIGTSKRAFSSSTPAVLV